MSDSILAVGCVKQQCITLKLKGFKESQAKKLSVEVVFQANSQTLPLHLASWGAEQLQAVWSLVVTAAELPAGLIFFHFRVNGAFALSGEHIRIGQWNAVYLGDPIRPGLIQISTCAGRCNGCFCCAKPADMFDSFF
ncbi:unnamed protein product [Cladocopium goreaui]|uniref:PPM-type phosphatase domain-containing protein n=1 Tax=Cladocopium goreaui TaxID=2562237 RepID=A0A9P1C355_9DINO|nr:unnamed protein product [Cladocopium goreaui]